MDVPVATAPASTPTPAPIPTEPTLAPAPAPASAAPGTSASAAPASATDKTVTPVVAQLFNTTADNVSVTFQTQKGTNEIVTVFTDKTTGKEIIQFPSQEMIAFGELLDKDAGKVLDKSV
jgi:hypothetical protein